MVTLPEAIPAIDFAAYKGKVPIAGMVEEFEKAYQALAIPYPANTYNAAIDAQAAQYKAKVSDFIKDSEARIAARAVDLKKYQDMIPVAEMTVEEFYEAFPEQGINMENPTFWPHTPETQPGYVAATEGEAH